MTTHKRSAAETRELLLQAAEELFVEYGFDGTRVDSIAAAAGVNKRMIYVYFGNKEGLYHGVVEKKVELVLNAAQASVHEKLDPVAQTESLIRWYFGFLKDNPGLVRLLGWEALLDGRWEAGFQYRLADSGLQRLSGVVREGMSSGVFEKDQDPDKLVMLIHSLCLGFFSRRTSTGGLWKMDLNDPKVLDEVLDAIVDLVLKGMCTRSK